MRREGASRSVAVWVLVNAGMSWERIGDSRWVAASGERQGGSAATVGQKFVRSALG